MHLSITLRYLFQLILSVLMATATPSLFAAGFSRIIIPEDSKGATLHGAMWYPCDKPNETFKVGPLTLSGVQNCPITGTNYPLIIISHGYGGSFLGHHDTAEALAHAGFIVVAITHSQDNYESLPTKGDLSAFSSRITDISRTIDYMTTSWPQRAHLKPESIGFFGFSRGGYTGLVAAGAIPDLSAALPLSLYLLHPSLQLPDPPKRDNRIQSLIIIDPLNLFTPESFKQIITPIQLWASELGGDGITLQSVQSIRDLLPQTPEFHLVPNASHFAFIAPCSLQQARQVPEICADPPNFNRLTFHSQFNEQIVRFFNQTLLNQQ